MPMFSWAVMLPVAVSAVSIEGTWHAMQVDGRPVDAWVPTCANAKSPMILSLHAWASTKNQEKSIDRLVSHVGSECAVIVYPQGNIYAKAEIPLIMGYSWNAGGCCPGANLDHVDDVAFLERVMVAVAGNFSVNDQLAFVVGISNGGMMANRLACSNSRIKAFVAVSGQLINGTGKDTETFTCDRRVPMLHLHGDQDLIVPYDGCNQRICKSMASMPGFPPLPWPTVPDAVADWRVRNGIAVGTKGTTSFTNRSTTCTSWGSVANNVTLCKIGGEGHAWPGQCEKLAAWMPGMHCSLDIDASQEVMRFFRQYVASVEEVMV